LFASFPGELVKAANEYRAALDQLKGAAVGSDTWDGMRPNQYEVGRQLSA